MVIVMEQKASEEQIGAVIGHLVRLGFDVHRSTGTERTVLGAVGRGDMDDPHMISVLDGVHEVVRISEPYKLASRAFNPSGTVVSIGEVRIGGDEVVVMAGPCSAENEAQVFQTAAAVKRAGADPAGRGVQAAHLALQLPGARRGRPADAARGGTREPEAGVRGDGRRADRNRDRYADMLQVGARNMQNFSLLPEVGRARKPILLKRGISATIEEWLLSAEYILGGGNADVVLCERGIRTFENYTRNTLDLCAIPVVKELSHLPIIVDPSHGTGRRTGGPDGKGRGRRGRRWPDHRGARRSGPGAERRCAVVVPGAVRPADGGTANHRARHRARHLRGAGIAPGVGGVKHGRGAKGQVRPLPRTWNAHAARRTPYPATPGLHSAHNT